MALPNSSSISIEQILEEMERLPNSSANLRDLANDWFLNTGNGKFNTPTAISLSLWRGETWSPLVLPDPYIRIITPSYSGTNNPAIILVRVESNISWNVRIGTGSPIVNINISDGNGDGRFEIELGVNNSAERTGSVEVYGNGLSRVFIWTQSGPYLEDGGGGNGGGGNGGGGGGGGGGDLIGDDPILDDGFQ